MSEKLKIFLGEEKTFFLKNNPYLNKVKNKKREFYFIIGDGGHMDIFVKIVFFSIILIILHTIISDAPNMILSLLPELTKDEGKALISFSFSFSFSVSVLIFPIYMLLSITNKKGILLGTTKDFLHTKINEDKIKKYLNYYQVK